MDPTRILAARGSLDLGPIVGPFFLGFCLQALGGIPATFYLLVVVPTAFNGTSCQRWTDLMLVIGMGVVLILSISYFHNVASRHKLPVDTSGRSGVVLVALSLVFNLAQTIIDLYRGYIIFGENFTNLVTFLTPTPLYFLSPFLGLFPAVLTQLFLVRRITLFISSLDVLWPRLALSYARHAFAGIMVAAIGVSAVAGGNSSYLIWGDGEGLYALASPDGGSATPFSITERVWLATSAAVDIVLCLVLCGELVYARRKLAQRGGSMREVVMRLILVTLHGGLAVAALQWVTLLLYRYSLDNAWCYLPILTLPKVYTITLILSLSLPQGHALGHSPSHVFSLPTITPSHPSLHSHSRTPTQSNLRSSTISPQAGPTVEGRRTARKGNKAEKETGEPDHRKDDTPRMWKERSWEASSKSMPASGERWSDIVGRSWRRSQALLSWSLVGVSGTDADVEKTAGKEHVGKRHNLEPLDVSYTHPRPVSAPSDTRRPSLAPLLCDSPSDSAPNTHDGDISIRTRRPSTISRLIPLSASEPAFTLEPFSACTPSNLSLGDSTDLRQGQGPGQGSDGDVGGMERTVSSPPGSRGRTPEVERFALPRYPPTASPPQLSMVFSQRRASADAIIPIPRRPHGMQHGTESPSHSTKGLWDVPDPFATAHARAWGEGIAERYDRLQSGSAGSWRTGSPGDYRREGEDSDGGSATQRTERLLSFVDMLGGAGPLSMVKSG